MASADQAATATIASVMRPRPLASPKSFTRTSPASKLGWMWISAPVSSAAFQNGSRSAASSVEPTPRGSVPIMRAGKTRRDGVLEHGGGARAVTQRHGCQRHETRLGFRGGAQTLIGSRLQASASAPGSS